jgi:hypothetical protein
MSVVLRLNGLNKKVSTGYSFKSLLFGFLYPISRGDYKGASRHFIYGCFTFGLNFLFTPFLYNRKYIKEMIEKGWTPAEYEDCEYLRKNFDYIS